MMPCSVDPTGNGWLERAKMLVDRRIQPGEELPFVVLRAIEGVVRATEWVQQRALEKRLDVAGDLSTGRQQARDTKRMHQQHCERSTLLCRRGVGCDSHKFFERRAGLSEGTAGE